MEQKEINLLESEDMLKKCAALGKENEVLKLQNAEMKSALKQSNEFAKMVIDVIDSIPAKYISKEAFCN